MEDSLYIYDGQELMMKSWHEGKHGFSELADIVRTTHDKAQSSAIRAVNRMQTMRNWLVGYYIVEFEQHGEDRAQYGQNLLKRLEESVNRYGMNVTLFKNSRRFYLLYPQMVVNVIGSTTKSPTVSDKFVTHGEVLISKLSFSHICEIMTIDDPLVRYFYEQECIRGTWSVRELRRQITTNLHVRIGLSKDPEKMLSIYNTTHTHDNYALQIREPFTFEFLGLKAKDVVTEGDIEEALITHLQEFILELGKGFCFESRQKRIIIDDEYYYPDLVFYNRILHCNVIVELKDEEFSHENLGQLNAYVSYYKENEMHKGDNPPVGILLCTRKGKKMVEYALAGMDNKLFVSTYMLQIPDKKTLEDFLVRQDVFHQQMKTHGVGDIKRH